MTPFTLLAQEAAAGKLSADLLHNIGRLAPEIFLCAMVVIVLLVDLIRGRGPSAIFPGLTLGGVVVATGLVIAQFGQDPAPVSAGYGGFRAVQVDHLGAVFKLLFLATAALTVVFVARSREDYGREPEFAVLLFGALAGMCYLATATDLVGFYLAFETVSYTGYLLAGYRTDSPKAAEAGGKYVIFGAVSSAVMLYGLSLLYGHTGSTQYAEIATALAASPREPVLLVAALLVFAGIAFKAAAFPFQFWCPDVYEGAPAPIVSFLALASKAAVFSVIVRVMWFWAAAGPASPATADLFAADGTFVQHILVAASVATMTWGNLAALRQTNLQRMLAYSWIAHAGYLLMTSVVLTPGDADVTAAILFYFFVYLCMNLGAFFVVTMMRRDAGSAEISTLRGLAFTRPALAVCFAVMLFSLTGLPPTAGFVAKFLVFAPVVEHGWYVLAAVGLLNGVVSLYFYMKPMREMFLTPADEGAPPRLAPDRADMALVVVLAVPLLVFGLYGWDNVTQFARSVGPAVASGGR